MSTSLQARILVIKLKNYTPDRGLPQDAQKKNRLSGWGGGSKASDFIPQGGDHRDVPFFVSQCGELAFFVRQFGA